MSLDMDPGPVSRALDGVQQPIDAWTAAWPGRLAAIHGAERTAQTGFDDISVRFRTAYNQIEPDLSARVGAFGPRVQDAVERGREIVAQYVETFQQVTDNLRPH